MFTCSEPAEVFLVVLASVQQELGWKFVLIKGTVVSSIDFNL